MQKKKKKVFLLTTGLQMCVFKHKCIPQKYLNQSKVGSVRTYRQALSIQRKNLVWSLVSDLAMTGSGN